MPQLTLYLSRGACSMAAHAALIEADADFSAEHLDLSAGEHLTEAFLKLNPHHQVPTLKVGDEVLTENVAILSWIAKTWPDARLLPVATPMEEAQSISYLSWLSSSVHTAFGPLFHPQSYVDDEKAQENLQSHARKQISDHFAEINDTLGERNYLLGDFSVADLYAFVFYRWARNFELNVADFSNYTAHQERLLARDSVKRMLEAERKLAKAA